MSAPDMRQGQGTAGAHVASGRATGAVRSYGMAYGEGNAPSPHAWPQGQPGYPAGQLPYSQMPYTHAQPGHPYAHTTYQVPLTSQPVQVKTRHKGRIIAIIVALIALVLAILLMLLMCTPDAKSRRQGDAGQLAGKSEAEIQAELDRVVEEGMFNISIASVVEFESASAPGDLRIENVPGNRYLMRVSIVRNDTGDQIYTTDLIEPNHHIQRDTLDVALPAGTYACTALFEAFDPETEEQIGQAAAVITLNVLS